MSMRRLMARAAGGLVIALGPGLNAVQAQQVGTDQQLVAQVAASNLLEVRLGQIAHLKGANVDVREFGQRMVNEHSASQKQWMGAAKKNNIDFKANLSPSQVQEFERINKLSGAEFDRAYMEAMIQHHRNNVSSFQSERNASHSTDVRQLIEAGLPTLQQHLSQAQQLGSQVGANPTASGGTPADATPIVIGQPAQQGQNFRADTAFITMVNASDSAELRLARLAQERASDSRVRLFAQRLASDRGTLEREWRALRTRSGMQANFNLNPQQQRLIARLEALNGAEFDRAYASAMVANHRQNVNTFQTRGQAAQSAEVRQLANRSLPSLQEHLTLASELSSRLNGAATPTTVANNNSNNNNNTNAGKNGNIREDWKFIRDIDADHFLEIRLGRLAEKRARNDRVKAYGRKMVQDHTALQRQWTTMGANNGLPFKSGMGKRHKSKLDRLEKMSGSNFDREYMTLMVQNHNDYLTYLRKEGRGANSAPVRQEVERVIPMLEQHINQAKQVGARVGADTTTSRYGRISSREDPR